jgi:hypothetical protein
MGCGVQSFTGGVQRFARSTLSDDRALDSMLHASLPACSSVERVVWAVVFHCRRRFFCPTRLRTVVRWDPELGEVFHGRRRFLAPTRPSSSWGAAAAAPAAASV